MPTISPSTGRDSRHYYKRDTDTNRQIGRLTQRKTRRNRQRNTQRTIHNGIQTETERQMLVNQSVKIYIDRNTKTQSYSMGGDWAPSLGMTSFSHWLYFVCLLSVSTVWNLIYNVGLHDPFLDQFQNKNSSLRPFLVTSWSSCFASHPITVLLKILGDGSMGRPAPQILGGPSP